MSTQSTPGNPGPLRALVIGAGGAAAAMHLPVLASLRDRGALELVVVCDLVHERAMHAMHAFGFAGLTGDAMRAIARSDIDCVYIFASAQLHYTYGLETLRHGKHLFVEKPIAPTFALAQELSELALERGLTAVGGHNRRFYTAIAAARAHAGRAGWRSVEAVFHKPELGKPAPFGARTWLTANGIHALDILVYIMGGLPSRLDALAEGIDTAEPALFSALMQWPNGAHGTFLCNNHAGVRREEYAFHAAGETFTIDDHGFSSTRHGTVTRTVHPSVGDGVFAEHAAFVDAIRNRTDVPHNLANLIPSVFLAELIEAGFRGEVRFPVATPSRAPHARSERRSILVAQSFEIQAPIAALLPDLAVITPEDIEGSSQMRPDVIAAILGRGSPPLSTEILGKLPNLVVVGVVGLSVAHHEPEPLLARRITLVNASHAYAGGVAEFALGLAILGRRRAFTSHDVMRRGGWGVTLPMPGLRGALRRAANASRPLLRALGVENGLLAWWRRSQPDTGTANVRLPESRELAGAVVGLIGWSANANAFTTRLLQAGARVLVFSERAGAEEIRRAGATPATLGDALAADIVSLHRGLTPETRHCLGVAELARLRPGAVFINTARGALVEPNALYERLARGDIFACLDTYEHEPLPGSDRLRRLPNVFLTSHIAGGSRDMYAAAAREVVSKVAAHIAGEAVQSISRARLRTMT
jgi:phosphoglycerate dehydrogenase-like enzyme/predicted dehydrogenase